MAKRSTKIPAPEPLDQIEDLANTFSQSSTTLTGTAAKKAQKRLLGLAAQLQASAAGLDPVREPGSVFNPANPRTVGLFVSVALLAQKLEQLGNVAPHYGSGVYAIYYKGKYPAYQPLVGTEHPIYIGKADPATLDAKTPKEQGPRLSRRVREHAGSIGDAPNLDIKDFTCRQLVVASGLQTAAEDYLIDLFKPIWNKQVKIAFGIGKHGDDPETRKNKRSPWDTLHGGREWASRDQKQQNQSSEAEITAKIAAHFAAHPPFKDIDEVLHQFYEDLKQR